MQQEEAVRFGQEVGRFEKLMLSTLDRVLQDDESPFRRFAVRLLVAWKTLEAMEIVYRRARKREVAPEKVDCPAGIRNGCQVFCCRTQLIRMTPEDVAEGLEMHLGMPWFLRVTPGGCYALDQATGRCTVWEKRPIACRLFNCHGTGRP